MSRGRQTNRFALLVLSGVLALGVAAEATGAGAPSAGTVAVTSASSAPVGKARLVAFADRHAARYGWGAAQDTCLLNLWTRESGWSSVPNRQGSGAFGVAQALGHDPSGVAQGTQSNAYGEYGVPVAVSRGANDGNERDQVLWGLAYIRQRWGSPCSIWDQYCSVTPDHPAVPGGGCWY